MPAKKPANLRDWSDFERRIATLCENLGMKKIDPADIVGLAALGLRLALDRPEFKGSNRRGAKLAMQPTDLALVVHAMVRAMSTGKDEKDTLRDVIREAEERAELGRGDRTTNQKRILRLYDRMGDHLRPIAKERHHRHLVAALLAGPAKSGTPRDRNTIN